jgi:hypothetical protein
MQGIPFDLTEYLLFEVNTTDTVRPQRSIIPIYYVHSFEQPFCADANCSCQRQKQEIVKLFAKIIEGHLELEQAETLMDHKKVEG